MRLRGDDSPESRSAPTVSRPVQPMNIPTRHGRTISVPVIPIVAALVLTILLLRTMRVGRIAGSEIGVFVNNLSGRIDVQVRPGAQFYCGLYNDFYVIDNTVQSLRLADTAGRKEGLDIKT